MKNVYLFLLLIPFFTSCEKRKTEQATQAISQTWHIEKYELNGDNLTDDFKQLYNDYEITFSADGNYTETYMTTSASVEITGTWLFQNHVNELKLVDPNKTRNYEIIELNAAKLTLRDEGTSSEAIYYFE